MKLAPRCTLSLAIALAVTSALCSYSMAAEPQWFGAAHDSDWFNIANWMSDGSGPVPGPADNPKINNAWNIETPIIFKPNAAASQVKVAEDRLSLMPMTLAVTSGGSLTADLIILGYWPANWGPTGAMTNIVANDGTLVINGGTVTVNNHVWVGFGGTGHLIMYGGILNIGLKLGMGFCDDSSITTTGGFGSYPGTGTIDLYGGVLHSEQWDFGGAGYLNLAGGTWVQNHYWVTQIQALVASGKIKAYGGNGVVSVTWDPVAQRTIVTGINSLFDPGNITVTANSPVIMDPCNPGAYDIANMFEPGLTQDLKSTIFMDGAGVGAIYYVEFNTNGPAQINTLQFHAEHDSTGTPQYNRAVSHFALKAKSAGSSTFDTIVYQSDISVPYPGNVLHLDVNLPAPYTGQYFRAEFTGYTTSGPRIRELNATGTLLNPQVHLWKYPALQQGSCSPAVNNQGLYDIRNMFEGGNNTKDTIFVDQPAGSLYYVQWTTPTAVEVQQFKLSASTDATTNARGFNHFTLKAKSPGSSSYDKVVYDTAVAIPYDPNVLVNKLITLTRPVIASQFRAEFTGNDSSGPRVTELDAIGYPLPNGLPGDLDASNAVDFKDYSVLAKNWMASTDFVLQNFDAYTDLAFHTAWSVSTTGFNDPTVSLTTTNAHAGKACELFYDTTDNSGLDPCSPCTNTVTYNFGGSPVTLTPYSQFKFWLKRASANQANPQFYVMLLAADNTVQASANIPGSTADPTGTGAYTQVVFNISSLGLDSLPVSSLKPVAMMQFVVAKGQNQAGSAGTLDIDDIAFTNKAAGDIDGSGTVDFYDLAALLMNWLMGK
jgi:hypothetical protein